MHIIFLSCRLKGKIITFIIHASLAIVSYACRKTVVNKTVRHGKKNGKKDENKIRPDICVLAVLLEILLPPYFNKISTFKPANEDILLPVCCLHFSTLEI